MKCCRACLRHPLQGIYLNQEQSGPLSDPHIAIATTAWPLRYEQCDGADEETQERWETSAIMKMYWVSPPVLLYIIQTAILLFSSVWRVPQIHKE